jgi:hypothetical protein
MMDVCNWICCVGTIITLILLIVVLQKINKCCLPEKYTEYRGGMQSYSGGNSLMGY